MRLMDSKRSQFDPLSLLVWVVVIMVLIGFAFGASGIIKFLISDKTPYIIGAGIIFILVAKTRRR